MGRVRASGAPDSSTVVGSQIRLMRCFRELEVASQPHTKISQDRKNVPFNAREPTWCDGYTINENTTDFTARLLFSRRMFLKYYGGVPETPRKRNYVPV